MNYKINLLDEILDLNSKITKLNVYIEKHGESKEKDLYHTVYSLLYKQLEVMKEYYNVLHERLEKELGE